MTLRESNAWFVILLALLALGVWLIDRALKDRLSWRRAGIGLALVACGLAVIAAISI